MMKKVLMIIHGYRPEGRVGALRNVKSVKYLPGFDLEPIVVTKHSAGEDVGFESPEGTKVYRSECPDRVDRFRRYIGNCADFSSHNGLRGAFKRRIFKCLAYCIKEVSCYPDAYGGWKENALNAARSAIGNENPDIAIIHSALADGAAALDGATTWLLGCNNGENNPAVARASGATAYLDLVGTVTGGYLMARSALLAHQALERSGENDEFYAGKMTTARFFAEQFLTQSHGLMRAVTSGSDSIMGLTESQF